MFRSSCKMYDADKSHMTQHTQTGIHDDSKKWVVIRYTGCNRKAYWGTDIDY